MKSKGLVISLLMVAFLFSGCGGQSTGNAGDSTPKAEAQTQSQTPNADVTPVKAVWYSNVGWNPPQTWSTEPDTVQGVITEKTGLTFEMNIPPQDADTKLNLMLASNSELPDVLSISSDTLIKKLIDAGKVWKIDDLLSQYDPESELFRNFPEDIKKALVLRDGDWYAYPSHMSSEDLREIWEPSDQYYTDAILYRNNGAIMFNTDLMEQAGISREEIGTEEGLMAALKKVADLKLTVNGASVVPLLLDGKGYQDTSLGILRSMFGGMEVDRDGNYRDQLLSDENRHAVEFLYKAYNNSFFDANQLTMDDTAINSLVISGRVFAFIGNTASRGVNEQENWYSPGPVLSSTGETPVLGMSRKTSTGWLQTLFSKNSKVSDRLAKFLSFMSSDEGMRLNYYGFENVHYSLNEKGLIEQNEAGRQAVNDYAQTGVFAYWPFHNISWHDYATQAPTDILTGTDGVVAMQVQSAFGKSEKTVIYDTAPLSLPSNYIEAGGELDNIRTQIKQYREAQLSKIILSTDDNTMNRLYDEMLTMLKELGIEKLDTKINEQVQKQYQEYGVTLKGIN